ncbi:glycoside hydrolase family 19 protein (plasmid) [Rhizobium leguminosarum]
MWRYVVGVLVCIMSSPVNAAEFDIGKALNKENLSRFAPRGRSDIINYLIDGRDDLVKAGINNPNRFYHFIAQIATETGGFARLDENMNYSRVRLLQIFPTRVSKADAARIAGDPIKTANWVYGSRLGNRGRNTNDGWNYRGSGYLQLTGRGNFIERGKHIGDHIEDHPEKVRDVKGGLSPTLAYWNSKSINSICDKGTIVDVRRAVNGGTIGLKEAKLWFALAQKFFKPSLEGGLEAAEDMEAADELVLSAVSDLLSSQGYKAQSSLESAADFSLLSNAIQQFEKAKGVDQEAPKAHLESAEDVEISPELVEKLTDPQNIVAERERAARRKQRR